MMNEMDEQEFKQYCESVLSGRDPLSSLRAARFGLRVATIIDSLRSQLASTQAELAEAREAGSPCDNCITEFCAAREEGVKARWKLVPSCTGYKAKGKSDE